MSHSPAAIQEFLSPISPFNHLPSEELTQLAERLQILRYRMGQAILVQGKMPSHIAIIYEGQARLLSYDPCRQMSVTLKLLEPGAILGWVNWARKLPCEAVSASTEVVCLSLNYQDFLNLLDQYPQSKTALFAQPSLIEVFELLGYQFLQQAQVKSNLKELAQELLPSAQVFYLSAKTHPLGQKQTPLLAPDLVWLVSGGGEVVGFPVGSDLNLAEPRDSIQVIGSEPARLLGFPATQWSAIAHQSSDAVADNERAKTDSIDDDIFYADAELLEDRYLTKLREKSKQTWKNYPYVQGKSGLSAAVACFQMLSQYFDLPFRQEAIRSVLAEQIRRRGTVSLEVCGPIAELMGLNTQIVTLPASEFTRLETPILVRWQDSLALLYEISDSALVIGVPEIGILRRQATDFLESWDGEGQVLLLKKARKTSQERFNLRWFFPALRRYRGKFAEILVASFVVQLLGLSGPLAIRFLIDKGEGSITNLNTLGMILLLLTVFETLLSGARDKVLTDTTNRIDIGLGSDVIDHLLHLPLSYFRRRPVGQVTSRVNELEVIRDFLTGKALTALIDTFLSITLIVVLVILSPFLTLLVLLVLPFSLVVNLSFAPLTRRLLRVRSEQKAQVQSHLVESITGIETVKGQNLELRTRWQWQENYTNYISAAIEAAETSSIARSLDNFLNRLTKLISIWVGFYLVYTGQLTIGSLIAFRIISGQITSPLLRLSQLWQNFQKTSLSLERLGDIMDTLKEGEQDTNNIPMPNISGAVTYKNVSFRFKSSGPWQLQGVNLEIPAKTFVAIVGESGAGKSTLIELLSRLYLPESGRIVIDGYDIGKVELYSLRRQIGIVPQEALLFEGTVKENIALTNPDATSEEIVEAARTAVAHEFIMNLPNGYNTQVGERGLALSGGQRQRITIARSLLQQPRILVLDEATSALDYATEQQVLHNLTQALSERTIFFVTHRLNAIQNAALIVVMYDGFVVEQGTHAELMALKGRYYMLEQRQQSSGH